MIRYISTDMYPVLLQEIKIKTNNKNKIFSKKYLTFSKIKYIIVL